MLVYREPLFRAPGWVDTVMMHLRKSQLVSGFKSWGSVQLLHIVGGLLGGLQLTRLLPCRPVYSSLQQ